jgi:hypothetical protein
MSTGFFRVALEFHERYAASSFLLDFPRDRRMKITNQNHDIL